MLCGGEFVVGPPIAFCFSLSPDLEWLPHTNLTTDRFSHARLEILVLSNYRTVQCHGDSWPCLVEPSWTILTALSRYTQLSRWFCRRLCLRCVLSLCILHLWCSSWFSSRHIEVIAAGMELWTQSHWSVLYSLFCYGEIKSFRIAGLQLILWWLTDRWGADDNAWWICRHSFPRAAL